MRQGPFFSLFSLAHAALSIAQAEKTMQFWRLPDTLVLHLKRFEYSNVGIRGFRSARRPLAHAAPASADARMMPSFPCVRSMLSRDKITRMVRFPLEGLDLSQYLLHHEPEELAPGARPPPRERAGTRPHSIAPCCQCTTCTLWPTTTAAWAAATTRPSPTPRTRMSRARTPTSGTSSTTPTATRWLPSACAPPLPTSSSTAAVGRPPSRRASCPPGSRSRPHDTTEE